MLSSEVERMDGICFGVDGVIDECELSGLIFEVIFE